MTMASGLKPHSTGCFAISYVPKRHPEVGMLNLVKSDGLTNEKRYSCSHALFKCEAIVSTVKNRLLKLQSCSMKFNAFIINSAYPSYAVASECLKSFGSSMGQLHVVDFGMDPWGSVGATQQAVGFVIVHDLMSCGIPLQASAKFLRHVCQDAGCG